MADPTGGQSLLSFNTPNERREAPKNYVFVDEKNRHRRLKVVRACEGCRKRKIKCDAANTNTWPCSACVRMKINCVPPTLGFDGDDFRDVEDESFQSSSFKSISPERFSNIAKTSPDPSMSKHLPFQTPISSIRNAQLSSGTGKNDPVTGTFTNTQIEPGNIGNIASMGLDYGFDSSSSITSLTAPLTVTSDWKSETSDTELTEALGSLKISDVAVAPYMVNHKGLADAPALQEEEIFLPPQIGPGHTVRIPEEMMPSEQKAMQYFRYFFDNVHPYIPVVYPSYFYRQWHHSRDSISPLILEGIFSCSAHLMDQQPENHQWLALASKHEDSFKDVPRLSTLQGLLLLLKAREAVPKRGYYYRSWMTVVNMVAMAKDLGLDCHYEVHQTQGSCSSPDHECVVKTRVWHSLYVVELMIGGPQGRTDYSIRSDTIDFDGVIPSANLDEQEDRITEQFNQFMRVIRNVRETSRNYVSLRYKKTDWALDHEFVQNDAAYESWLATLPRHLQISFPGDDSAPWVPSHFLGNLHSYHKLAIIMHHRPQLQQSTADSFDGSWKRQMMTLYHAAKQMCRLQEALSQQFGLTGLLCMQRGMSFHIYAILTCIMLHLVAVTSPDSDINHGAAEYFARHMRILEQCTPSWPIKEIQLQIESLRQAFSADVNRPFELRPNFPGSPPRSDSSSPPSNSERGFLGHAYISTPSEEFPSVYAPLTPPRSSASLSGPERGYNTSGSTQVRSTESDCFAADSSSLLSVAPHTYWNPTRIFDQWNTAFGMPPASVPTNSNTPAPGNVSSHLMAQIQPTTGQFAILNQSASTLSNYATSLSHPPQQQPSWSPPTQSYVTPSMWQHAVSSTYGEGLKRRWNETPSDLGNRDIKRVR